jgi:AcrR family transcriptional regulator
VDDRRRPSRPADAGSGLEREVHAATLGLLERGGYGAVSVDLVAAEVGVDDAVIAARWPSVPDLATAAVASLAPTTRPVGTGTAFEDLVAELLSFRRVMAHPAGQALAGVALDPAGDAEVAGLFRDRVVRPQRIRLRRILDRARAAGEIQADDVEIDAAISACIGSWYALAVAGVRPARDWGTVVAGLTWRSLRGRPPG